MGNIFGDLQNASKALNAHRFGVTTAGNNIANVNNPNFSRQRAVLGDTGTIQTIEGPRSLGVEVIGFQQMRDAVLDKEILREGSLNASLEAQLSALDKAEASTGQTISRLGDSAFVDGASGTSSGGLAEVINDFFNSFHSLSANPASDAEKEALIQNADILAEKLNVTSTRFSDIQEDLTLKAETDLAEANGLIKEIARLNAEVARAEAGKAGQALDLRDERQARLEDLSELIQIQVSNIPDSGGQIRVAIATPSSDYVDLVEHGRSTQIIMEETATGLPKFRLDNSDADSVSIRGGSIHGALTARDGAIQEYVDDLDKFASELVTSVNAIYNGGTPPMDTNFFLDTGDSAQKTAAGISLDATLSSTTFRTTNDSAQNSGDNTLVLAIAELDQAEHASLGDRTFSSYYRSVVTDLAETVATVDSKLEDEKIVFDLLKQQRDSVSGVSIDEEMTDMMKFQRAYQATGKLISAIDEMLDVVINRLI